MERKVRSGERSHKLQDRRELVTLHGNVPSRSLSFLFWNVEGLDVWVESSGKAGHRGPRRPQQGRGGGWRSPAPVTRGSSAQTRCTNTPKLCIIPPEVLVGREGQAWSLSRCSRTGDLERTTAWWRHSTGQLPGARMRSPSDHVLFLPRHTVGPRGPVLGRDPVFVL